MKKWRGDNWRLNGRKNGNDGKGGRRLTICIHPSFLFWFCQRQHSWIWFENEEERGRRGYNLWDDQFLSTTTLEVINWFRHVILKNKVLAFKFIFQWTKFIQYQQKFVIEHEADYDSGIVLLFFPNVFHCWKCVFAQMCFFPDRYWIFVFSGKNSDFLFLSGKF